MTNFRNVTRDAPTGVEDWVMIDVRLRAVRGRMRARILRRLGRHLAQRLAGAVARLLRRDRSPRDASPPAARWIAPDAPLILPAHAVRRIYCEEGIAWITAGDGADHVLRAGEALALEPAATVIISALNAPARIRLQAPRAGFFRIHAFAGPDAAAPGPVR